jgi:hypothetical protein
MSRGYKAHFDIEGSWFQFIGFADIKNPHQNVTVE